jgi:hypothetical protein
MLSDIPGQYLKVNEMDATATRIGRYLWSALLISVALASFYGLIWVLWS